MIATDAIFFKTLNCSFFIYFKQLKVCLYTFVYLRVWSHAHEVSHGANAKENSRRHLLILEQLNINWNVRQPPCLQVILRVINLQGDYLDLSCASGAYIWKINNLFPFFNCSRNKPRLARFLNEQEKERIVGNLDIRTISQFKSGQ